MDFHNSCSNSIKKQKFLPSETFLTSISHLTYPKQSVEQDQQNFEKPQSGNGRQRFTHFDDSSSSSKSSPLGTLLMKVK